MTHDIDNRPIRETDSSPTAAPGTAKRRRRPWQLPEIRWATFAVVTFLLGLSLQLGETPAWMVWAAYLCCYLGGGWGPAVSGLQALRERKLDVDLLMIVAALGAAAIGHITDGALLIVIFAVSGALEAYATARTSESVRGLLDLTPETATRIDPDGGERTVPANQIISGDIVLTRPGERIGADGEVVSGTSEVNQANITGESLPVAKSPGSRVFAGTLNGTGSLRIRTTTEADRSVISRIVAMVDQAATTKSSTRRFIDRIEQRYSLGIVIATPAIFGIPLAFGEPLAESLMRAMTFMIVASPCAVVLATMPPLLSAMANAGRHGVLIKSAEAMERLGEVDRVALDKTGTLTSGRPRVNNVIVDDSRTGPDENELLRLAASVEHHSEHPLGMAIREAAARRGLALSEIREFKAEPGRGVRALVAGVAVEVVSAAAFAGAMPGFLESAVADMSDRQSVVVVLLDGQPCGVLGLGDDLRPEAATAVSRLRAIFGSEPELITGDNDRVAWSVARRAGIEECYPDSLPHEKVSRVEGSGTPGDRWMMIGDGVNDAPALASAHCGVAMGRSGADLTVDTADVVVVRDDLKAVARTVELSRKARRLVTQNLVIAAAFIGVLVAWDLFAHLPLPLGVAGHEGSTVLVGLNGLRLLRERAWYGG